MEAEKLLRAPMVMQRIGCKQSKFYSLIARGQFPKPIKIDGCSVWPESKVSAWIAQRIAESEAAVEG